MITHEGQTATFDGVLINEKTFRQMSSDVAMKDELGSELQKCLVENVSLKQAPSEYSYFMTGLVIGIVSSLALIKR